MGPMTTFSLSFTYNRFKSKSSSQGWIRHAKRFFVMHTAKKEKKRKAKQMMSRGLTSIFSYKYLYISLWEVHCIIFGLLHKYMNK